MHFLPWFIDIGIVVCPSTTTVLEKEKEKEVSLLPCLSCPSSRFFLSPPPPTTPLGRVWVREWVAISLKKDGWHGRQIDPLLYSTTTVGLNSIYPHAPSHSRQPSHLHRREKERVTPWCDCMLPWKSSLSKCRSSIFWYAVLLSWKKKSEKRFLGMVNQIENRQKKDRIVSESGFFCIVLRTA